MKLCDLTQFYSPLSGGVKRYLHQKIAFVQNSRPDDEHVLIVPGAKDEVIATGRSRIYSIRSPVISRATQYRALLDLRALSEIVEREQPDILESSDPYQVGWKAIWIGRRERIPVVGFYHSHFIEAYLRRPAQRLGSRLSKPLLRAARAYVQKLYNCYDATLVPSARLARVLDDWGVENTRTVSLGLDATVFHPAVNGSSVRDSFGIPNGRTLLLYVGRLAQEKNTHTLFEAFSLLRERHPGQFHLLVVGDGQQRDLLRNLQAESGQVTWIPYCTDSHELAKYYRAADLFAHPGVEETFGLVALESQACGTPVAGIRGSFMDDVILHDQESWAQENSPAALAHAMEEMGGRTLSVVGSSAAAQVAARYAWPRVFARLFCVYQEVCARYRKATLDGEPTGISHP